MTLDDLVLRESRAIAKDILEAKLAGQNLPLPKESSLDIHLDALINANPQIVVEAEAKVRARKDAYSESLKALGIGQTEIQIIEALDLDL